ncbi:MAG: ATP-dependent helicase [Prolixibacteraceae bacterium]|nr:ATP-dependent helicase [Prolixibacteraceae bacterium]
MLLEKFAATPFEILAVTFTNKAAGELKDRLKILLKNRPGSGEITVATFHAFGLSVLRKFHNEFNRTENFLIVDEDLKIDFIKFLTGSSFNEAKKLAAGISAMKSADKEVIPFYRQYEEHLVKMDAFDLDDLIIKPLELLNNNKEIRSIFQKRFSHIFVDEYQDINQNQFSLLRLLAPDDNSNLCVVGDANQSIYGFRGAAADYINRFTIDYPSAKVYRLIKSYRCSQTILTASSNILNHSSGLLEGISGGVHISLSEQPTGGAEAEFIARQIEELMGGVSFFSIDSSVSGGEHPDTINSLSDLAILCRTRTQFSDIKKALQNHNLPWQETGTTPFFRQEPFQTLTTLLNALSANDFKKAETIFRLKNRKLLPEQFETLNKEIKRQKPATILELVRARFFKSDEFNQEEWNQFTPAAESMTDLREFSEFLALGTGADTYNKKLEAVSLMTIHASKGLEFECVFIPGCEKGLIPYELYKTDVDREEEKRLLYVGMTRAKKLLYLTYAKSRTIRGRKFNLPVSPFIKAIQSELLSEIKNKPPQRSGEKDSQLSLF